MACHSRTELSEFDKGRIEGRIGSMSHKEISQELAIPRTTISSFISRLKTRGNAKNLFRPGRPRKTTSAQDKRIVAAAEAHSRVPLKELSNIINIDLSTRTLQRRLQENGIRKWRAVQRALLTEKHAAERLKWAIEHRHMTREDWARFAWSDETAIQKDSCRRQVWIYRHENKQEKYAPQNIQGKTRDGQLSQMIWGCFVGNKLGPIVFINGIVNSDVYIHLLHENFLPYVDALQADDITNIVFQQDNARPHVSQQTHQFLEAMMTEHHFSITDWPANSPDMNLMENLWSYLKLELDRKYPDTKTIHGPPQVIRLVLAQRLTEIWWNIAEEVLDRLVDSMPHRIQALIEAKGWYTEY